MGESMKWVVAGMRAILLLVTVGTCVGIYKLTEGRDLARKSILEVYEKISRGNQVQLEEYEQNQMLYGKDDETHLLWGITERLVYSGIRGEVPWMNASVYICLVFVLCLLLFAAGLAVGGHVVIGLAFAALFWGLQFGGISILIELNFRKTEKYLIPFMNMVENYAASSDDLLVILENAGAMVGEPVNREVLDAVSRARRSGDAYKAVRLLQENIEHPHFKRLMGNLEKCSRGTADYRSVIGSSRGAAERYLTTGKEIREVYKNGRGEILIMAGGGLFLLSIMQTLTGSGENVIVTLGKSFLGKGILWMLVAVFASAFWFCLFGGKRHT